MGTTILWFIPQMGATAMYGPDQKKEPQTPLGPHVNGWDPNTLAIFHCFPTYIGRDRD